MRRERSRKTQRPRHYSSARSRWHTDVDNAPTSSCHPRTLTQASLVRLRRLAHSMATLSGKPSKKHLIVKNGAIAALVTPIPTGSHAFTHVRTHLRALPLARLLARPYVGEVVVSIRFRNPSFLRQGTKQPSMY